ncbi:MAG TPA: hypothetical protein DCR59_04695, partial [Dehalococcoidia bacterium]|nr:hypothetical protein [Dehalococcoidia bacterium]
MSQDKSAPPKENPSGIPSILVAEADAKLCSSIKDYLDQKNYCTTAVADGPQAVTALTKGRFDLAILSMETAYEIGLEVLSETAKMHPEFKFIITSKKPTADSIAECMKRGAFDYLTIPFGDEELAKAVDEALGNKKIVEEDEIADSKHVEKHQEITSMMEEKRVFYPP